MTAMLFAAALATPLALLAACVNRMMRERMPTLLVLAPVPALLAVLVVTEGSTLTLPAALLNVSFVFDTPGAMLLGAAALLWIAAGRYAGISLRSDPKGGRFAVWWLMTLTGSLGVFIAADLVGFYLFYSLVSLAAYGLIVQDDTPEARRAGAINISLAVLGEALLLMAFVLLAGAAPDGSLLIRDVVAALPNSSWRSPVLGLLVLGFGLKIGLVPFHVWMPLTYSAAPVSAAAVLSGAAVNAGVIGFIRFLPFETALVEWGYFLAAAGLVSAFYGVAIGVTQTNPRSVLAYSSVSQLGLIAGILGMGLVAGDGNATSAAAFYALHHTLVKGGLFLAIGAVALGGMRGLGPVLFPAAVLALALAGLPLTGGALAKLVMKEQLGGGLVGTLATISAVGSTILMLHFLRRLAQVAPQGSRVPAASGLALSWLAIAAASIVLPWALFFDIADEAPYRALTPAAIWETLWPILVGVPLAVLLWRWQQFLPRIPEGDVLAVAKHTVPAWRALGSGMERVDGHLRQWTVAGLVFLAFTIIWVARCGRG